MRGDGGEARHRRIQAPQQLRVDGRLKEAVKVLAVREAEEVLAVAAGHRHGERDGVQQQVHELLVLQRGQHGGVFIQQTKTGKSLPPAKPPDYVAMHILRHFI